MRRASFITLLCGSGTAALAETRTPDEVAEDAVICDLGEKLVTSFRQGDFERVAAMMHPAAFGLFHDAICTGYEKLVDEFGREIAQQSTGLSVEPRDLPPNRQQFFTRVLREASQRHPHITQPKPGQRLRIIGGVVEPQLHYTFAYILYRIDDDLQSSHSITEFSSPSTLTLMKQAGAWLVWTSVGTGGVLREWREAATKARATPQK